MNFFTILARVYQDDTALIEQRNRITDLVCRTFMQIGLISLAILITSVQLFSATPAKSQTIEEVEVKLELNNESLLKAFKLIEEQSPFIFMYRKESIKNIRNLRVPASKKSIAEFLETILANTSLSFKQLDSRILITPTDKIAKKGSVALSESSNELLKMQEIIVSGRVTDASGEALVGVSVMVKGSSGGTTTDASGNYSISIPNQNAVLTFTYVGFLRQEIPVGDRTSLNVSMQAEQQTLNEVVVTALGIEREAKSLTYSTQNVSTEEITEAREVNIMNSLQGKVAGLSINSAGSGVGADARVILRGNRSISGDSQPLYIVDGVPINGNPTDLSSDNVASIDVLKGPNAAALYGSAAQNGAIIITTKQGKAGEVSISLNHTSMMRQPVLLNKMQNVYAQGQGGVYDKNSEFSWGPKMEGQMVDHWSLDPADAGSQYALTPQPDNNIDAYQTGINTATNLLASIGGEKTQTVFSYTYTDAKGILPGNDLNRHNISLRINNQLSSKLALDSKIEYMRQRIENGFYGNRYNPYRMIDRIPRSIHTEHLKNFEYTDELGHVRQNYFNPGSAIGGNPYWILNRTPNQHDRDRVIAMTSLTYAISDDFKFMVRGSYDGANNNNEERLYNDNYASAPDGQFNVSKSNGQEFNADFLLSYTKDVAEDWNIGANIGGNLKKLRGTGVNSSTGVAMIIPNFFTISNTNFPTTSYSPGSDQDIQSLYAFTTIAWRNALFLDLTGRNDWSSTLPADNRSYFYPSVGLSAVLSDLVELPDLFSFTKLRASWAQVGNSAPPYMIYRTASFSAGGNNGFLAVSPTLPNTNLRPEMTKSFEIGADIRFLENRLGLDITAYKTNTSNQLFTVALPVGSGASEFFTNGGDVENKGIEVLLSGNPVKREQFRWDINLNYAVNRNIVKKISDERPRLNLTPNGFFSNFIIEEGEPFGNIYSRGFLRDEQGRVIVADNGLPRITPGQTVLVGNFSPDWTGAITNSFSYKNFSASILIEHRQGGTVASETNAILYSDGVTEQTLNGREGNLVFGQTAFSNETAVLADGSPNTIPITSELLWRSIGGRNTPVGEAFVDDATNTRLRELTIGYTFPKSLFEKTPISDIKLSLVGRNLFFIYRKSENLDPDFMGGTGPTSEGTQAFTPATTRSFGLNLKVGF